MAATHIHSPQFNQDLHHCSHENNTKTYSKCLQAIRRLFVVAVLDLVQIMNKMASSRSDHATFVGDNPNPRKISLQPQNKGICFGGFTPTEDVWPRRSAGILGLKMAADLFLMRMQRKKMRKMTSNFIPHFRSMLLVSWDHDINKVVFMKSEANLETSEPSSTKLCAASCKSKVLEGLWLPKWGGLLKALYNCIYLYSAHQSYQGLSQIHGICKYIDCIMYKSSYEVVAILVGWHCSFAKGIALPIIFWHKLSQEKLGMSTQVLNLPQI